MPSVINSCCVPLLSGPTCPREGLCWEVEPGSAVQGCTARGRRSQGRVLVTAVMFMHSLISRRAGLCISH